MGGLKEIRLRISSVKSTRQITSAMKMVAAARLKGAQDKITGFRPFAKKMDEIISGLGIDSKELEKFPITAQPEPDRVLIVLFTSNRGLCGGFNTNIYKKSIELIENSYSDQLKENNLHYLCIGRKGADMIKKKNIKIIESVNELYDDLSFENVSKMADRLINFFLSGDYSRIELVYNEFKNAAVQVQKTEPLLPVDISQGEDRSGFYIFEPNREALLNNLVPKMIRLKFFKAILDSNAAEQGARMTAMHQATDNATELIRELTLQYNKARQAAITNEILEITSGAEALKS
ncbi:MAG TPA: ATP synthase F1 subunit gamma [Bacteroidales bacterium]|nr:ATP synthase F1 subunit gamma [Bacteroidales bacterium]HXK81202.1 ATP synthase F1 subunit gamma [Bacteroidales bacterium]